MDNKEDFILKLLEKHDLRIDFNRGIIYKYKPFCIKFIPMPGNGIDEPHFILLNKSEIRTIYVNVNLDAVKLYCWELGLSSNDVEIVK